MRALSISQVASQFGMRPSALRYYERIGILQPPARVSGQRRYDASALRCLAVIRRSREVGFTLEEIRELFSVQRDKAPASARWRELTRRKRTELEAAAERIRAMQEVLEKLGRCGCAALDECGEKMLRARCPTGCGSAPR